MPTAALAGEARNEAITKPMPKMTTLVAMLCSSEVPMSQACSAGIRASCVGARLSTKGPLSAARTAIAARPAAIRPSP